MVEETQQDALARRLEPEKKATETQQFEDAVFLASTAPALWKVCESQVTRRYLMPTG